MVRQANRSGHAIVLEAPHEGELTLSISGRIAVENLRAFNTDLKAALNGVQFVRLVVDLSGVGYVDSAGALALWQLEHEAAKRSASFQLRNPAGKVKGILSLLDREALYAASLLPPRRPQSLVEQVGGASRHLFRDFVQVTTFLGELLRALAYSLRHPRSVRGQEVLSYMKRAGADGLPIVGLISLLLGLVIAFMSSLQLRQFGANIFVASLVAVAIVKELGPIMTAIIVAGRSGSAFAAEIGTMMVNEEVDALLTMGFDPVRFLAVPKVLAIMLVVPLLTLYADFFGILGGLIVGVLGLHLTVPTYVLQTQRSLYLFDVLASLIKSLVFAGLIAGIGCQRGFQVRGGAEAVGASTTSAVVAAIFLIIAADSVFAVVLNYLR